MSNPMWQWLFESWDMSYTRAAFEVRHPYLDLRLLRFMLSVPALPWARRKYLLRRVAQPLLPGSVVNRNKVSLTTDPAQAQVTVSGVPAPVPSTSLATFIDPARFSPGAGDSVWTTQANLRVVALSYWLEVQARKRSLNGAFDATRREEVAIA